MESGPLARWAGDRGIPFLAVRVVLDPSETDLPFSGGAPLWTAVLGHPLAAARVARDAIAVGRVLGKAVNTLTETFSGSSDA